MLKFEDYNAEELYKIGLSLLQEQNIYPDLNADAHLKEYFEKLHLVRDRYFGNARTVRQLVNDAIKNQHLRLASATATERTQMPMDKLILEDLMPVITDKNGSIITKKTIGFVK
jgi:hypothetical protein